MSSYTKYWKNYVDFKGRSSQQDFWDPILINLAVSVGLTISVAFSLTDVASSSVRDFAVLCLFAGLLVGWKLARLVPDAALIVRRTHDAGITGWVGVVLYIASFIPYINFAADVLIIIIGCMATDSANFSAFAWQPDQKTTASTEKTTRSNTESSADNEADTTHYEQLSLDLNDLDQKSDKSDKSDK